MAAASKKSPTKKSKKTSSKSIAKAEKLKLGVDVVIIGGGPGGYVCAIKSAQLGLSVAVVEKRATLGGTCLNVGCIPSKALLASSEKFADVRDHYTQFGIDGLKPKLNLKNMMKFKDQVVDDNTKGIDFLFGKNKIQRVVGTAKIDDANTVSVTDGPHKGSIVTAKQAIIIATGSAPASLPNVKIDEEAILSSTGGLEISILPKSMIVIGGGYIGLEMGAVWHRLGTDVTIVEYLDRILPGMDTDIAKEMYKVLDKQGLKFKISTKVTAVTAPKRKGGKVTVKLESAEKGGKAETLKVDKVLVAIGRTPYTDGLGLDKVGVDLDDRGRIKVDGTFETNVEGIYAIGDVIEGPMLAHKAEEDGVALAEMLAGQAGHVDYDLVPGVVYTSPEAASLGKTEDQLKEDGVEYTVGKFPFSANGRARSVGHTDGFVKIIADKKTDKVLGCHIIGHEAGCLIHEVAAVMAFGGSSEDIARICHAHPTLNEVVKEAAHAAAFGKPIHM